MEAHQFLRKKLEQLDLSLADLEARLNLRGYKVTKSAIGHWVTGRRGLPLKDTHFVELLAYELQMSVGDMLHSMGYTVNQDGDKNPTLQRINDIVERLPPDQQELALRLVEQLVKTS